MRVRKRKRAKWRWRYWIIGVYWLCKVGLCPELYESWLTGVILGPAAATYLQALTSFDL
jgi:hypothetical protein